MRLRILLLMLIGLLLAACGTPAAPRPSFDPTPTALPRAANIDRDGEQAELVPLIELEALEPLDIEPTVVPLTQPEAEAEAEASAEADAVQIEVEPTIVPEAETSEAEAEPSAEASPEAESEAEAEAVAAAEASETEAEVSEEATEEATEEAAPEMIEVNGVAYEGDAFSGEIWFSQLAQVTYQNVTWNCATCHNVEERLPGSGPYLYGLATVAGERVEGEDAITYLVHSILHPNDFISPAQTTPDGNLIEWLPNVMPNNWNSVLDDQTIADIVAYLLTLDQPLD